MWNPFRKQEIKIQETVTTQRKCEKCPNLLPVDANWNKRFCLDCKYKRQQEYLKNYYKGNRTPRTLKKLKVYTEELQEKLQRQEQQRLAILERNADIFEHRLAGDLSLEELGKKWGITRERVRQIEAVTRKAMGRENDVPERICKYCERTFFSKSKRKFCTAVCGRLALLEWYKTEEGKAYSLAHRAKPPPLKRNIIKKCVAPGCNNVFLASLKDSRKYCGSYSKTAKSGCSLLNQQHFFDVKKPKICQKCGILITGKSRGGKKYCGYVKTTSTKGRVLEGTGCALIAYQEYVERGKKGETLRRNELIKQALKDLNYDTQPTEQKVAVGEGR